MQAGSESQSERERLLTSQLAATQALAKQMLFNAESTYLSEFESLTSEAFRKDMMRTFNKPRKFLQLPLHTSRITRPQSEAAKP